MRGNLGGRGVSRSYDIVEETFTLSVIIPTLNEDDNIVNAIKSVSSDMSCKGKVQIIVVDGESNDSTVAAAKGCGVEVLTSKRGRGTQMNAGAARASGDWLLFLHADAKLPDGYWQLMLESLQRDNDVREAKALWGCFSSIRLPSECLAGRVLTACVRWRTELLSLPYGDQGIFVRRETFWKVGGYMDAPLMEDVDLVKRLLRQAGRPAIVPVPLIVSARRWERLGYLRTSIMNLLTMLAYKLGADPNLLARWYHR